MDTSKILAELKQQREALNTAISALEGTKPRNGRRRSSQSGPKARPKRRLSAAARKRISEAAKARWAKAKRAGRNAL